jgi:hypothetical protein
LSANTLIYFNNNINISGIDVTVRPPDACGYNEATCSNKQCIPKSKVCDGQIDCSDGSDETRCSMFKLSFTWNEYV